MPARVAPAISAIPMPGNRRSMPAHIPDQPAKKQSKWSPEEDALITQLRARNMKWEDISKHLPGRSAISCRLHYQNYLERRSEWDEDRKNKLARLYERFKQEMWMRVADELSTPWRAVEAMHWQLGEKEMARRAGVNPFQLATDSSQRISPSRTYQPQPYAEAPREYRGHPSPQGIFGGGPPPSMTGPGPRPIASRQGFVSPPMNHIHHHHQHPMAGSGGAYTAPLIKSESPEEYFSRADEYHTRGTGLAPIQPSSQSRTPGTLPSVAELTTGVRPYESPTSGVRPYESPTGPPSYGHPPGLTPPYHHAVRHTSIEPVRPTKRRASSDAGYYEPGQRRRIG